MTDSPQDPSDASGPRETPAERQARIESANPRQDTREFNGTQPTRPYYHTADNNSTEPLGNPGTDPRETRTDTRQTKAPRRFSSTGLVAALVVGALVGGVSGAGVAVWAVTGSQDNIATAGNANPATITVNDAADATVITAVAAEASPSVVTISVAGSNAQGTGSGVIFSTDGYVLTNTHVVTLDGEATNTKINVQTYDGHLYDATLIGTDPITDLAVIKITSNSKFQAAEFADSGKLNVGDVTIAIGAPLGLANTVTNGIVSALNRSITVRSSAAPENGAPAPDDDGDGNNGPFDFWQFGTPNPDAPTARTTIALPVIQTDAAINPGNSGGALLDSDGKVIGINVAIASTGSSNSSTTAGSIGVGFAIPSNLAKRIAGELKSDGSASHGLLGATVMSVTDDSAASDSETVGASIQAITGGGAADQAGMRKGDIVTKFNDLPITSSTDLTAQVRAVAAGTKADVTYVRDGKANTVTVTLGELK